MDRVPADLDAWHAALSLGAAVLTLFGKTFCSVFAAISGQESAIGREMVDSPDGCWQKACVLFGSGFAG